MPGYSFNAAAGNRQSTYSSPSLGGIYQFGRATPYGPYTGLPRANSVGGTSTSTTATSGPTNAAESWLNDVIAGKNLPFSPFAQQQMLSQQSDMNAAAEGAQNQQLQNQAAVGGASASDPSFKAGQAANMAHRQTANTTAARDISTRANQANFGAQMDAAGQLNQNAITREGFQRGLQNTALGFMPWNQGGGSSGGNNFTGTGLLEYQNANLGSFRRPATNTGLTDKDYYNMGL
jgi:hypothetical protein